MLSKLKKLEFFGIQLDSVNLDEWKNDKQFA